jgi:hypothetical protein
MPRAINLGEFCTRRSDGVMECWQQDSITPSLQKLMKPEFIRDGFSPKLRGLFHV